MNTVDTLLDMRDLVVLIHRTIARIESDSYDILPQTEKDYIDTIKRDLNYAADNINVLARLLEDDVA